MIAALAIAAPAVAQEPADTAAPDTVQLEELVVTATRVPLPRSALPTPVSVWTGEELRRRGIRTVARALRQVPGAAVVRAGAAGAQTSLFLRGAESDYVKVLIDGVPVNDPGGAVDFADLSTDQVERIEVVRGPVSVLYGSDAVAGVVQIFTRRGAGPATWSVTATGGRGARRGDDGGYGLAEGDAMVSGSAGEVSYTLGVGRSWSAGLYPFNSDRSLTDGTARLAWTPAPAVELSAVSRLSDSESHFPTDGAGALVDENARIDRRLWTTAVEGGWAIGDRVDARLRLGLSTRRQATLDPVDGPADTLGTWTSELAWDVDRRSADARVDVRLPGAVATGGFALERATAETRYDSDGQYGPGTAAASYDRTNRGYYAQLVAEPLSPLAITLGGRVDDNASFGTFVTYRAGLSLRILDNTRLRAAVGRGFREPSFDESFGSGFGDRGNPGLDPERSRSVEVGIEQRIGRALRLQATAFDQRFRDLIQFTFAPTDPEDPNYFNVGAARSRGLEIEADVERGRTGLTASYTRLETEVLDPGLATDASFRKGETLLRRPRDSGSIAARYRLDHGALGATLTAVGEREDLDFAAGFPAPRVTLPAHATLDLVAEHRLPLGSGPRTDLLLRVENLLDTRYETVLGFPAPGRVIRLGVRLGPTPR